MSAIPLVVRSLAEALKISTPIVARIEEKKVYPTPNARQDATWYLARAIQTLGPKIPADPDTRGVGLTFPRDMPAETADEFYVRVLGPPKRFGNALAMNPDFQSIVLEVGKTYLLFVRFEKNLQGADVKIGTPLIGRAGVLLYVPASGSFQPTAPSNQPGFTSDVFRNGADLQSIRRSISAAR